METNSVGKICVDGKVGEKGQILIPKGGPGGGLNQNWDVGILKEDNKTTRL